MSRKQRGKVKGPGAPGQQQQQARPQAGGSGWGPLRDAVRREIEQASSALAFAERLHTRLDTQRRLFVDFSRVMEQLRSGALERIGGSLSRLFEGGQGFDLQRFLRDLPLALSQLAAAEAQARRGVSGTAGAAPMVKAGPAEAPAGQAARSEEVPGPSAGAPLAELSAASSTPPPQGGSAPAEISPPLSGEGSSPDEVSPTMSAATSAPSVAGAAESMSAKTVASDAAGASAARPAAAAGESGEASGPVSPRLELRSKLLAAAPQLAKAATVYRRNVATVKRAAAPRRSPGPWRSDREVLEEARRAVEFARQLFDAYAEAWADHPLAAGTDDAMAAEMDRFLAWTQLDRYVELAVHGDPRHSGSQPPGAGRKVVGSPPSPSEAGAQSPAEPTSGEAEEPSRPAEPREAAPDPADSSPIPASEGIPQG